MSQGTPEEWPQSLRIEIKAKRVAVHAIHQAGGLALIEHLQPIHENEIAVTSLAPLTDQFSRRAALGLLGSGNVTFPFLTGEVKWAGHQDGHLREFLAQDIHESRKSFSILFR